MKNLTVTLFIACLFSITTLLAGNQKHLTIYFNSGDYHLLSHEKMKLDSMKNATMLILCGHTDADGSAGSNYILSEKRVKEVFASLQKMGIDQNKMRIDYRGENQPLNTNLTDDEKAMNRRVDIIYSEDPLLAMKVATQHYSLNNKMDTTFILKEGTKVFIPANAFEGKKVDLSIREFVSNKSILAENLTTKSGVQNLETAGMLYMEARVNNQIVNPTEQISLTFKNTSGKTDFKFFEGEEKSDLSVDWSVKESKEKPANFNSAGINLVNNVGYFCMYNNELTDLINVFLSKIIPTYSNDKYYSKYEDSSLKYKICFNDNGTISTINNKKLAELVNTKEVNTLLSCIPSNYNKNKISSTSSFEIEVLFGFIGDTFVPLMNNYYGEYEAHNDAEEIILKTTSLGWINCDRFALDKREKIAYAVVADEDVNVRMIMKSQKSFFNPHQLDKKPNVKYFGNTPVGENIILIATVKRGDKLLLAIADTKTSKTPFSDFKFEEVSLKELEKRIDQLKI